MSQAGLTFCIFSFNRGRFLKNCVDSIRACVPDSSIAIFDDDSDDPETLSYLDEAHSFCRIFKPREVGKVKHGGLYLNMQVALEQFANHPLVCFLQDDTQVVRPVSGEEVTQWYRILMENSDIGFIHPCFLKGINLRKRPFVALDGPSARTCFRKDMGQSAGVHYSDLVIAIPARLLDKSWHFCQSEPQNDRQARQLFGSMIYLQDPFVMWLPEVPTYRGKKKTIALKLAEHKKNVGFYPFKLWSQAQAQTFRERSASGVPVAEEMLTCSSMTPPKPWTYTPLSGLRLLKNLNNFEVSLRKLFKF